MAVFKEELNIFEGLHRNQPTHGGYNTADPAHANALQTLRNWMKDMAELKYDRKITMNGTRCTDYYFIGWEHDDGYVPGVRLEIETTNVNGKKYVRLDGENYRMSESAFNRYFK